MKCEMADTVALDYFYDEMSTSDRAAFETHLASCGDCRKAVEELTMASGVLHTWEAPRPHLHFVFVSEHVSRLDRLRELLPSFSKLKSRPLRSLAYGCAAAFLLLSLTNFTASYDAQSGSVAVSSSLFGTPQPQPDYSLITQELMRQVVDVQNQMLLLVDQSLTERETRQMQQINAVLAGILQDWRRQRESDLQNFGYSLVQLGDLAGENIRDNRALIMALMKTAGVEIKK